MRRHYYQMMLLSQFELGAMLSFSSRISHAVEECGEARCKDASRADNDFAAAFATANCLYDWLAHWRVSPKPQYGTFGARPLAALAILRLRVISKRISAFSVIFRTRVRMVLET